ncbi:MAG: hypothetical protein R3F44_07290 [Candidatus Competibacteraceae bacterium]
MREHAGILLWSFVKTPFFGKIQFSARRRHISQSLFIISWILSAIGEVMRPMCFSHNHQQSFQGPFRMILAIAVELLLWMTSVSEVQGASDDAVFKLGAVVNRA